MLRQCRSNCKLGELRFVAVDGAGNVVEPD